MPQQKVVHEAVDFRMILKRVSVLLVIVLLALIVHRLYAAELPNVRLTSPHATPRDLEDTTQKAIVRDYAKAWHDLGTAVSNNDPDALSEMWIGFARDEFTRQIRTQRASGMTMRIIDHSHSLEPMFYSVEGSSMQLRDTAQVETQVLDGGKVVASNTATVHYLVIMTPGADHWLVRKVQAVPSF